MRVFPITLVISSLEWIRMLFSVLSITLNNGASYSFAFRVISKSLKPVFLLLKSLICQEAVSTSIHHVLASFPSLTPVISCAPTERNVVVEYSPFMPAESTVSIPKSSSSDLEKIVPAPDLYSCLSASPDFATTDMLFSILSE